jgi:inhibitor of cysteine peptidase
MSEIVVTQANSSGMVSANVGDTLVIQLPETPTTGFRWTPVVLDAQILEPQGDTFILGAASGVGGGGMRVFRFGVKGQGNTSLQFKLARAWESRPSAAVFDVHVTVTGS